MKLDLSTSLTTGDRIAYVAAIDDILAKHGEAIMSCDTLVEKLQDDFDYDLAPKRHLIKLLIIERLKKQPTPRVVAGSDDCSASTPLLTVFNLPELLEAVLSHLSTEDLLVTGRVNKAFHRLIATSPTLQKKLFLLPGKGQPKWQLFQRALNGQRYAVVAPSTEDISTPSSTQASALGNLTLVARINPLLRLYRPEGRDMYIEDVLQAKDTLSSAVLDKRILELNLQPHMYLTDPPCTCVHIDVIYHSETIQPCEVLRVRRRVYGPTGVTFGAIHDALHAKGPVAVYGGPSDVYREREFYISPDTSMGQQLEFQERDGYHLVLAEQYSVVEFCHLALPSEAEFEEMNRTGRVEGSRPPELDSIE